MAHPTIELIAPHKVLGRVLFGVLFALAAFLWPVRTEQDQTLQLVLFLVGTGFFVWGWRAVRYPLRTMRYAWNPRRVVVQVIRDWKPQPARLESEYEKSLHRFLKDNLPFVKITRQYGSARVKCDLATGNDVMIELKAGFRSTQKLQRLIGQVDLFRREFRKPLVVVLLGETEEDLLHDLHRSLRDYSDVEVVTKAVAAPAAEEAKD